MSSNSDICLLLYVIKLADWLKHCDLAGSVISSVSLSLSVNILVGRLKAL